MSKLHLLYGFLVGVLSSFIGILLFIELFTPFHYSSGIEFFSEQQLLGKIITLGTVLNIGAFFLLLRFGKEDMAKGVIIATAALLLLTVLM